VKLGGRLSGSIRKGFKDAAIPCFKGSLLLSGSERRCKLTALHYVATIPHLGPRYRLMPLAVYRSLWSQSPPPTTNNGKVVGFNGWFHEGINSLVKPETVSGPNLRRSVVRHTEGNAAYTLNSSIR